MNKKTLFISAAAVLVLAFFAAIKLYNNEQMSVKDAIVANNLTLVERANAPIKGPKDAKVTIVEFFDPACGTCSNFYPLVNDLIKQYPGKVNVMMRYAPLHQGSGQVVKMLEAAHLQGKFWPAVELLFANQARWVAHHVSQPDKAQVLLNSLGLNREQFASDVNSASVNQIVQKDIRDGQTLNIRATPEFYVNGKPMPSFGYEQLKALVADAVDAAY